MIGKAFPFFLGDPHLNEVIQQMRSSNGIAKHALLKDGYPKFDGGPSARVYFPEDFESCTAAATLAMIIGMSSLPPFAQSSCSASNVRTSKVVADFFGGTAVPTNFISVGFGKGESAYQWRDCDD